MFFWSVAYAQAPQAAIDFVGKINRIIINPILFFIFALATVYFIVGVIKFFTVDEAGQDYTDAKQHMLWGLVGMLIIIGVFGIIQIILGTLGIN